MAPGPVSALTAGDTLLAYFWELASLEEEAREKAATALVDVLVKDQKEFEAESGAEQSEEDTDGEAAPTAGGIRDGGVARALRRCSPLMVYAFKRLCRGLGSSRQGARQGFSLAITNLLASTSCIAPREAVMAIAGVLETVGKGSELRDALLGRIFGYAAVVRSGQPIPAELAVSMATGLVQAAQKKSFLREVAGTVLLELCNAVDDSTLLALVKGGEAPLASWLTAAPADASPEALLLALRMWPRLPAAIVQSCPLLPAGTKCSLALPANLFTDSAAAVNNKAVAAAAAAFFSRQHLTVLLPVLRGSTSSHPRLHSVWPTMLALLIPGFSADKSQRNASSGATANGAAAPSPVTGQLEAFWSCAVDGDLVQSSHERKYLAFTLFLLLLPHLGPEHVPLVFTPAFLRCLATNVKKGDSYLHAGAKKCMERIASHCDKAAMPEVRIAVSLALQRHGGADLERFAAKAAAKQAKSGDGGADVNAGANRPAQAKELEAYVLQLQNTFLKADSGGEPGEAGSAGDSVAQQRQWAIEQLCGVLRQAAAPAELKQQVLKFLAVHALFSIDAATAKKSKDSAVKAAALQYTDIPLPQRQLCAARLIALADTLDKQAQQHQQGKGARQPSQQQKDQQDRQQQVGAAQQQRQQHEFIGVVAVFVSKLRQSGSADLATVWEGQEEAAQAAESAATTLEQTLKRLQVRLSAGSDPQSAEQQRLRALAHLLRLLLLHSLADPASADPALASDMDTVFSVAVEGQEGPLQRPQRAASSGDEEASESSAEEDEQQPHWHDTLMDVLLSLLARNAAPLPSAPLRDAVEHVFRAFADDLTATGMADMLRVLTKPLDSSGSQDGEEDVYASSEEEEEETEETEEEEMEVDADIVEDASEAEEEAGSSEGEEEQEDGEKPVRGTPATAAAAAAQGTSDDEGDEAGGSASDEEAMSDEAMFRMDAKLAGYFASLKEGRGGNARAARQELVNFKMRVASLVEAFCKRVPASPLLPSAVAPLLSALASASRPGGHQPLAERLSGLIVHKLCGSKAEAAGAGLAAEELEQQLRRTLYLASRTTDKRVVTAAGASYVFLQRAAAAALGAECRSKGLDSALAALSDYFLKKKTRLQRPLLESLLRRVPALVPGLLPEVLRQAAAARNEYLRLEAFLLLSVALKMGGSSLPAVLSGNADVSAAAVRAAVSSKFSKPQRQIEVLKVACHLLERVNGSKMASSKGGTWQEVRKATSSAIDAAAGNAKMSAALQRLEGLLAGPPATSEKGTKRAKPAAKPAPKKQKV